jgi:two-component system, cell cycle sensor histidine kinase and response regulator CckA
VDRPLEKGTDRVLVLRAIRDESGRVRDAVVEFVDERWRLELAAAGRDVIGLPMRRAFPEADAARWQAMVDAFESRRTARYAIEDVYPNGGPIEFLLIPFDDRLMVLARMGLENRLDADLFEHTAELEAAREIARIGTFQRDLRTGAVRWSAQSSRFFGTDPALPPPAVEEVDALLTPESVALREAAVERSAATGEPWEVELEIHRPDGSVGWCLQRGIVVKDAAGMPVAHRGTFQDVTERKFAGEVRRASEELYSVLVNQVRDGVVIQRRDGAIIASNPAACRILGFGAEQLSGLTSLDPRWAAALPDGTPVSGDDFPSSVVLRTGMPCTDTLLSLAHPSGRRVWLIISSEPLRDARGDVTAALTTFIDVTKERELEARLEQSQRLESIGRLTGGVAHDFNNILTAISGTAQLLAESVPIGDPRREDVDTIRDAGDRAAALTRLLLAFGRQGSPGAGIADLGDAVRQIAPLLRRTLGEDLELRLDLDPRAAPVGIDRTQFDQVVVNLAVNARDAMPNGGTLAIGTIPLVLTEEILAAHPEAAGRAFVCLSVADTGLGIQPDVLGRIFEPYYTTKGAGKGTGLGLPTTLGIVTQAGGWIDVTSEPGRGTVFLVCLPRADGRHDSSTQSGASTDDAPGGGETILLVEDEEIVRAVVGRMLRDFGYTVLMMSSPRDAFEIDDAVLASVDLLVTDVVMPGMSGVELADGLAGRRPNLRTLFMSGFARDEGLRRRLSRPETAFLSKPFGRAELAAAVRAAIDGH